MAHPAVLMNVLACQADFASRLAAVFGQPTDPVGLVERRAAELLPDRRVIIWEGDPQTFQFTHVSRSAEDLLGYPCKRWLAEAEFWTQTVIHPDDRGTAVAYCALATGQGRDHDFRYRARTADGRTVVLHDVVHVIKGRRGVAIRLRGIMVEVTADVS